MRLQAASLLALAAGAAVVAAVDKGTCHPGAETKYTATKAADVEKAAATAKTSSPTSNVKGKAFDRIAIVYFENQNYDKSIGDRESTLLSPGELTD
jgi:acid phosphatase